MSRYPCKFYFFSFSFGVGSGILGVGLLASTVNGLTAGLGLANILLYTSVYTPMKRTSILNTAAGAVVGAIPPLMVPHFPLFVVRTRIIESIAGVGCVVGNTERPLDAACVGPVCMAIPAL